MKIKLDRDGYLADLSSWSDRVAVELARREKIALREGHWALIHLVRDFYGETGVSPAMRPLVKLARERMGADYGSSLALMKLFPGNPAKLAAKIGGLPRPTNCL
ncbi:MAG: TusE/DsrC/DsvC family sulfur relay protein [Gammaproteobacteria bacterium]|nr:TusE/DsrC/DsvC family sulfur relay protein [Gammaproteobacteria bacterium]